MSPSVIESRETKQSPYQSGFQLHSVTLSNPRYYVTLMHGRKPGARENCRHHVDRGAAQAAHHQMLGFRLLC